MSNARKVGFLGKKLGFQWTKLRSPDKPQPGMSALKSFAYNRSYFPQLGMMFDDARYPSADVKEALKRLPPHLLDERTFRIDRAIQLSSCKQVLPREEWMTMEKDTYYLSDILEQIEREKKEKKEWANK